MERHTVCFPRPGTRDVMQHGDPGFADESLRLYSAPENNALEALIALKARLYTTPTDDFWEAATEGMSKILGAEMTFVMKRVLVDEQKAAVEMPPQGAPGSCMMAAAFHYCSNDGSRNTVKQSRFAAYGCPCAYMRHDKVFLIPDRLNEFITNNPNKLPTPAEAYMAVPLSADGKCFAHFGVMWSKESAAQRQLSWAFIEMLMLALEDMMLQRFLEGSDFIRLAPPSAQRTRTNIIPHDAVTIAQSLRPYAGSLSHELRTPMQGVVGMLDVMYATVQEAVETSTDPKLRMIFQNLKENIEVVQDSSRRAVEAADNVVHAYDMNMSVPDMPFLAKEDSTESLNSLSPFSAHTHDKRPEILVAGSDLPISRPNKRRRDEAFSSRHSSNTHGVKFQRLDAPAALWSHASEPSQEIVDGLQEAKDVQAHAQLGATKANALTEEDQRRATGPVDGSSRIIAPGLRHTNMREVLQYVINEDLKVGGRPDSAVAQETELGESIEVRSRGSDGTASVKIIDWSVSPSVPSTMFVDEKDLTKLISCVFLNAIKFTDQSEGRVGIHARMSSRQRYILIRISDNGPGIPAAFLPKLFKPFSREDGSTTRPSEGLGLGLLVAKGIARKLGGDLTCIKAETEGSEHGSEFEIKIPVHAGETISRPSSPFSSPMPRRANLANSESFPVTTYPPASPSLGAFASAANEPVTAPRSSQIATSTPDTPPSPKSISTSVPVAVDPPPQHTTSHSDAPRARPRDRKRFAKQEIDRELATKYPLNFLVAEDNKINRKLLVNMLIKLGYKNVYEAHNGAEAVHQMTISRPAHERVDVILMDLWMPLMDGYEATQKILSMEHGRPTVLAVTADVTDGALERAAQVGMTGAMTKPYKMLDLQRLITEYCARSAAEVEM